MKHTIKDYDGRKDVITFIVATIALGLLFLLAEYGMTHIVGVA